MKVAACVRRRLSASGALTPATANLLAKALEKALERRYPSITAHTDDIRRCLNHEPLSVRGRAASYRMAKFVGGIAGRWPRRLARWW